MYVEIGIYFHNLAATIAISTTVTILVTMATIKQLLLSSIELVGSLPSEMKDRMN